MQIHKVSLDPEYFQILAGEASCVSQHLGKLAILPAKSKQTSKVKRERERAEEQN